MKDISLEAYLENSKSQGQAEGEGSFTISHEAAVKKAIEFSLPRENTWVLLFVQAAVKMGCDSLELTRTRTNSTFRFIPGPETSFPCVEELLGAILKANFLSSEPRDKIGTALRILVDKLELSFLLSIKTKQREQQSMFAGHFHGNLGKKKRQKLLQDTGEGLCILVHHLAHSEPNRLLFRYLPLRDSTASVALELEGHAFTSPIKLSINDARIDGLCKEGGLHWHSRRKPLWFSPLSVELDDSPAAMGLCQQSSHRVFALNDELLDTDESCNNEPKRQAYLALGAEFSTADDPGTKRSRSLLHWLKSGVIVETEELAWESRHLCLHVFANAEGLPSDLSGFALTKTEGYFERKAEILSATRTAFLKCPPKRAQITSHPPFDTSPGMPGPDGYVEIEMLYQEETEHLIASLSNMIWSAKRGPQNQHPKFWKPVPSEHYSNPFGL